VRDLPIVPAKLLCAEPILSGEPSESD
jgi:hypothetical protein